MVTVCDLKVALKAKGIKGISGLNKSGLQSLLNKGGSNTAETKEPPKPKPFKPAETKGASPVVAEKKIDKKTKPPQQLRITYKEPTKATKTKAPPVPKLTASEKAEQYNIKADARIQKNHCLKLMKKAKLTNENELKKYIISNHPDKIKNYNPNSEAANLYKELLTCYNFFKK